MFKKWLKKRMYQYAYCFARTKQKVYFINYLKKYIQKHIKYRSIHDEEYNALTRRDDNHDVIVQSLKKNTEMLIKYMYQSTRNIYDQKKKFQANRLFSCEHYVDDTVQQYGSDLDPTVLRDLVTFSLDFQNVFTKSDLTAKTKLQEHWCMRLPVYIICLTLVLVLRWLENAQDHMFLVVLVYIMSIWLVFLRFHQSVSADTKKLSSELYTEYKNKLLISLAEE